MDEILRARLRSYGFSFDESVERVATSLRTVGYESRHARAGRAGAGDEAVLLRSRLNDLGMFCLQLVNEFPRREASGPAGVDTLAVAAEVGRLVSMLREAQRTEALTGRAAFELDGVIDEMEERFRRMDDFGGLVMSATWMVSDARPFFGQLPEVIRESLTKLERLLPGPVG